MRLSSKKFKKQITKTSKKFYNINVKVKKKKKTFKKKKKIKKQITKC